MHEGTLAGVAGAARIVRSTGPWVLGMLTFTLAIGLQLYVGRATIYADSMELRRAQMHEAILHNTPPAGRTWKELGAVGVNTRIGIIYLAEALRRTLNLPIGKVYLLLETGALVLVLASLFLFLRRCSGTQLALIGLLYTSAIQPLTYFFNYFHPWDRPSLLAWIAIIWLIKEDRPWWAAAILPLGVAIKWDIIVLPGLYLLIFARKGHLARVVGTTAALGACGVGTYILLRSFLPGGSSTFLPGGSSDFSQMVVENVQVAARFGVSYPPLLGLCLPVLVALIGVRRGNRFEIASFALGMVLFVVMFMLTYFLEIRAEMPLLVLILPLALRGVESLVASDQKVLVPA